MAGLPVLLFLDVSGGEFLIIVLVVFLVFGPEKMPEIARKFGKAMNQMKKASSDLTREFNRETSSIRNEIDSVKNKVSDEVEGINREINRTKAQVVNDLSISDDKPETAVDAAFEDIYPNEKMKAADNGTPDGE